MKDTKKGLRLSSAVFKLRETVQQLEAGKDKMQKSLDRQLFITIMIAGIAPALTGTWYVYEIPAVKDTMMTGILFGTFAAILTLVSAINLIEKTRDTMHKHQEIIKAKQKYLDLVGELYD